jgi:gluconokinase
LTREFILGLDIGTSSVRAALCDRDGKIIPNTLVKNERQLRRTPDGGSEIDADKAFSQLVATIDNALGASEKISGQITHVAASCFWHSLVGVDGKGRPTTKVLSWADNRSRDQINKLRMRFDEAAVHDRTGARFHSSFWPAKLLWLRKEQPDAFARTAKWLSLSDYLALKLLDDPSTSVSMASATGLFDIRKCDWDANFVKYLELKTSQLPVLADSRKTFRLNKTFSHRWPQLADAEWFPAIGDGAANNVGSGCVRKTRAALMLGTSGAIRIAYRGKPPEEIPEGLWCYRIDRQRVIVGGALSDGGGLYKWLNDNLRLPEDAEKLIAKRPAASHGLIFLPFLAGERSTGYNEDAQGAILGLTSATDAIDIMQAGMEAVGYRLDEIICQLDEITNIKEIAASGGALRASTVWTQMIADILGRSLTLLEAPEASLRGAVLLALETIGNIENIEEISPGDGRVFVPDDMKHEAYERDRLTHEYHYGLITSDF